MLVFVNSKATNIPKEVNTVSRLLDFLRIPKTGTGIGINNNIVLAKNWDSTEIKEEYRIIIISASYGG